MIDIMSDQLAKETSAEAGQKPPLLLAATRVGFAAYFLFSLWTIKSDRFIYSNLHFVWLVYLFVLYLLAEKTHSLFMAQSIDLTYALPILFSIYCLNLVTLLLGGQERLPLLNRAEHLASFVLIAYIIWIFFTQYLPQDVWKNHPYYTAILVISVTSLLGVSNEILELVIDHLFATEYVGRQYDTSLDLLMNTLGSGLFLSVRLILGTTKTARLFNGL